MGAGPAGLTAAGDLAKHGYKVTVYEALHAAGGVLVYGIPEFRLPKAIVQKEIDKPQDAGRGLESIWSSARPRPLTNCLSEYGYEAVFIGSGAGLPRFMGIEGETLAGVYSANEYLTRINLMKAYREGYDTPIRKPAARPPSSAAATWPWTLPAAPSAGGRAVYIVYRRG